MCKLLNTLAVVFWLLISISSAHARLIHHWKLDENTGGGATVAVDSVGGLNGDIDGAQSVPGKASNALSFDGADDVVTIENFVPPQQGTIVFWINPALAKSKERIFGAGGDYEVWLRGNGELKNELFDNGSSTTGTGPGALKANEWNHIAATYDSITTTVEIYMDGELWIAGTAEVLCHFLTIFVDKPIICAAERISCVSKLWILYIANQVKLEGLLTFYIARGAESDRSKIFLRNIHIFSKKWHYFGPDIGKIDICGNILDT